MSAGENNIHPIRRGRPYVIGIPPEDLKLIRRSMEIDNTWRMRAGLEPHKLVGEYVYSMAFNRIRDELIGPTLRYEATGPLRTGDQYARIKPTRWQRFCVWAKKIGGAL